jgi:spermidine/putrescine-binding protein
MMALKPTKVTRTSVLFTEIEVTKSTIKWNQERIGELVLLALEQTYNELILLDVRAKSYKKAFDNYQKAVTNANVYIKHSDDLVW